MKHATLRLPDAELAQLEQLARENDRSVSAEVRIAVRAHLAANSRQQPAPTTTKENR